MPQVSITVTFQDASGAPLANGSVTFDLNVDISTVSSGGTQVCGSKTVKVDLDVNGSVTLSLWPNDTLFPSGSVYFVRAFTSSGLQVFSAQATVSHTGSVTWTL